MSKTIKGLAIVLAVVAIVEAFYILRLTYETKVATERARLVEDSLRLSGEVCRELRGQLELQERLCRAYHRTLVGLTERLGIMRSGSAAEMILGSMGGPE